MVTPTGVTDVEEAEVIADGIVCGLLIVEASVVVTLPTEVVEVPAPV